MLKSYTIRSIFPLNIIKSKPTLISKSLKQTQKLSPTARLHTDDFRWASDNSRPSLTPEFILSSEQAPRLSEVISVPLPTIDMAGEDEAAMAEQIAAASAEFGFFRVINHRIPEEAWVSAATAVRDFFLLPPEVKRRLAGVRSMDKLKVYRYFLKDWEDKRDISMWSEIASQIWHPTDDFAGALPKTPPGYREHLGAFGKDMGVLMTRLMSLLSIGLGLEESCIKRRLGHQPFLKCHGNYFPPCPNPELALGLPIHSDSVALSVIRTLDDVPGLQILKDEQWIAVDQPANSYKSVVHRVVTNETRERVSLAFFWGPGRKESVGPIASLIDEQHPPAYKSFLYDDYLREHDKQVGKRKRVKQMFQLQPTTP
ncbi:hypothetical protein V2J09_004850 [Rumex salicifolius]